MIQMGGTFIWEDGFSFTAVDTWNGGLWFCTGRLLRGCFPSQTPSISGPGSMLNKYLVTGIIQYIDR